MVEIISPAEQESNFMLRVYFRQNSSWQGLIQRLDRGNTIYFRSLLEMTMLMLEAMREEADRRSGARDNERKEDLDTGSTAAQSIKREEIL